MIIKDETGKSHISDSNGTPYNDGDFVPIVDLGFNLQKPTQAYRLPDPNDSLVGKAISASLKQLWFDYVDSENKDESDELIEELRNEYLSTVSYEMFVSDLIRGAITRYYPDPNSYDRKDIALKHYKKLVCVAINYFIKTVMNSNKGYNRQFPFLQTEKNTSLFTNQMIKDTTLGFNEVIVVEVAEGLDGVPFLMSRNEDFDPMGKPVPLFPYLKKMCATLISADKTPSKSLFESIRDDGQAHIYISSMSVLDDSDKEKSRLEYIQEATPANNGIMIPSLYDDRISQGKPGLLTYREAWTDYNIFLPFTFAANYLGRDGYSVPIKGPEQLNMQEWIEDTLQNDPDRIEQLFAIMNICFRPYDYSVSQCFIFKDDGSGETGKSTVISLIQNIIGSMHVATMSINDFCTEHGMEQLINGDKAIIVCNENDVEAQIKGAGHFKDVVSHDPVSINPKYKPHVSMIQPGHVIQAVNGAFKIADKTNSMYRRFLILLFMNLIGRSGSKKNTAIKKEYIKHQDVLDYFLTEAINRGITVVPESAESRQLLSDMKEDNSSVRRFFNDYIQNMSQLFINVNKIGDLYEVFTKWASRSGHPYKASQRTFENELKPMFTEPGSGWSYYQKEGGRPGQIDKDKAISKYCLKLSDIAGELVEKHSVKKGSYIDFNVATAPQDRTHYCLAKTDPIYELFINIGYNNNDTREMSTETEKAYSYIYRNNGGGKAQYFYRDEFNTHRICRNIAEAIIGAELLDDESILTDDDIIYMLDNGLYYEADRESESSDFVEDINLLSKVPGDVKLKRKVHIDKYSDEKSLVSKLIKLLNDTKGISLEMMDAEPK